jgi:hypothetical protein
LEYKKNKIPITQGKLERLKLKAEKQIETVFGINLKKLRDVMFNDEIDDFMSAIDHCYKMRNKHADEESNKKYTDVFNIYKPMDSA